MPVSVSVSVPEGCMPKWVQKMKCSTYFNAPFCLRASREEPLFALTNQRMVQLVRRDPDNAKNGTSKENSRP